MKKHSMPERPPCNTCGKPATCMLEVAAYDLELREIDRYIPRGSFCWGTNYEHRAHVRTRLCESCFAMAFHAKIEVDASVQGEGEK